MNHLHTVRAVLANFELTTEVRFLGLWDAATGAWTDALTSEAHLPASQNGLGTCLPGNREGWGSVFFILLPALAYPKSPLWTPTEIAGYTLTALECEDSGTGSDLRASGTRKI